VAAAQRQALVRVLELGQPLERGLVLAREQAQAQVREQVPEQALVPELVRGQVLLRGQAPGAPTPYKTVGWYKKHVTPGRRPNPVGCRMLSPMQRPGFKRPREPLAWA
jgi:hypothetical protein